jgi:hypothetical protein
MLNSCSIDNMQYRSTIVIYFMLHGLGVTKGDCTWSPKSRHRCCQSSWIFVQVSSRWLPGWMYLMSSWEVDWGTWMSMWLSTVRRWKNDSQMMCQNLKRMGCNILLYRSWMCWVWGIEVLVQWQIDGLSSCGEVDSVWIIIHEVIWPRYKGLFWPCNVTGIESW